MLTWVRALCGERSWERQDLGEGTSPFQPVRGFPRPLPARKDLRKFLAESPRLPRPAQEVTMCDRVLLPQPGLYLAPDTSAIWRIHHRWAETA